MVCTLLQMIVYTEHKQFDWCFFLNKSIPIIYYHILLSVEVGPAGQLNTRKRQMFVSTNSFSIINSKLHGSTFKGVIRTRKIKPYQEFIQQDNAKRSFVAFLAASCDSGAFCAQKKTI